MMKTIEEEAKKYARGIWSTGKREFATAKKMSEQDFSAGAKWMREELTRWHDPKEELPEPYKVVEVRYRSSGLIRISTAWMAAGGDAGGYDWTIDGTNHTINRAKVIGWREINE